MRVMRKIFVFCLMFVLVTEANAQFWGGFIQGALMGTENALRQQQMRKQQEQERRRREAANRIDKRFEVETGFSWYKTRQNGKVGAEDNNHNTLIPLSRGYESVYFYDKEGHIGYFEVKKNGKEGVCDITGREIISPNYESVLYLSDGFSYRNASGNYVSTGWYLDSEGKATKEVPIYKELQIEDDGFKWYQVSQGDKYGAEDYFNQTLIPLNREYTSVYYTSEEGHKGYFQVRKGDKYGACDLTGKEIVKPNYKYVIYTDGFKGEMSDGEWVALGYMIDSEGKAIRGSKESIVYNGATYYIVSREGLYGLTDANGKEIVAMEMDKIESAGGDRLIFKQNDSWGLMNFLGKVLVPTSRGYTSIGKFSKTQKTFPYTMYGYKGEINVNGQQLSKIKVDIPQKNNNVASTSKTSDSSSNSGGSSTSKSSNTTSTIVVEHHHDPIPVQEWIACGACGHNPGVCQTCLGMRTSVSGRLCISCKGSGKCHFCNGEGGRYQIVYR